MSGAELDRVAAVFEAVLAAEPDAREGVLERACGGDAGLRAEVESLLRADRGSAGFMDGSVVDAFVDREEMRGRRVGAWVLEEAIGEGGMGVVYSARRADGAYEQEVAVKLIRGRGALLAGGSGEMERRFRRERQVLASLRHENIARLLDGGVADGRPFLVMELVRGEALLAHCDRARLGIEERLALFDGVCAGVQHAHANLVVHRDLKPAHIVVDGGRPKLLDFGIAVVLEETGGPLATRTGCRRLTPQYASPEQVRGEAVTTASDVYALGLILYELLTGQRAYEVEGVDSDADRRTICEQVPPAPRRRLEQSAEAAREAAAVRGVSLSKLRRVLGGDLGAIVMTALRKEPERRYASAEALRADLSRWRRGLPVSARADGWWYRSRKFASRNPLLVGTAAAAVAVLIGAVVVTSRQAGIAAMRRAEAERALATSDAAGRFLRSVLVAADPREGGQAVTMLEAVDRAAGRIEQELGDEPAVEARVREAIGMTYRTLGQQGQADAHLTRAHELAGRVFADDPEAARIAHELAVLRLDQGGAAEAEELAAGALAVRERRLGAGADDTLETRNLLALICLRLERTEEALEHAEAAAAGRVALLGEDDPRTLEARSTVGKVLWASGRMEAAAELMREVHDAQARVLGADHPDTLISASDLGATLVRLGRVEEGVAWQMRSMEGLARRFPEGSLDVVIPRLNIAGSLQRLGRYEEARALAGLAVEHGGAALGEDHHVVAVARMVLGRALLELGKADAAREALERAHAALVESVGPEHGLTRQAAEALERAGG